MKKLISLALAAVLCLSLSATALAGYARPDGGTGESVSVLRAEETEWVYRTYNGNIEKRLWSITYSKWLTDWIYVGPAP